MKKVLSIILAIAAIASMLTLFSVNTAAANNDTLTITYKGETLAQVKVGNAFIFRVGLNSGGYPVQMGQATVRYDSDYVQIIEHGPVRSNGSVNMDAYSFPVSIRNMSLVTNFTGIKNEILYNFSKYNGVDVFSDVNDHYFKVRFKAIAPGTTEIRHYFQRLSCIVDNKVVNLIYEDKENDQLDPIPYTLSTVEPAIGHIGDADGDGEIAITDATFIQYITAGKNYSYNLTNTDVNNDGEVNLKDALNILRYKAGATVDGNIGEWVFESEQ